MRVSRATGEAGEKTPKLRLRRDDKLIDMEVRLTPEQEALVQQAIAEGRYGTAEEALQDAVALWEENERRLAELRALIAEADANTEGDIEYDEESSKTFVEDLIREARALRDANRL